MESTQGLRWDVVFAASVALAATTGLFLGLAVLMQAGTVAIPTSRAELHLVWILPATSPPRSRTRVAAPKPALITSWPQPRTKPAPPRENVTHYQTPSPTGRPLSAVYLDQVRANPEPPIATPDPLADRVARLPGEGHERFRMREQTSVANVVNRIGRMFGGRDPDEPCRENRRNIGELALDGDSAALRQQLEYEHRLCRP